MHKLVGHIDLLDLISKVVKDTFIVGYGVIEEVLSITGEQGEASQVVGVSSINNNGESFSTVAYILGLANSKIQCYTKPKKGDKVLLISPQYYNDDMFFEGYAPSISSRGYSSSKAVAIPLGVFTGTSDITVDIQDDAKIVSNIPVDITIKGSDGTDKIHLSTDDNGNITIDTFNSLSLKNKEANIAKFESSGISFF